MPPLLRLSAVFIAVVGLAPPAVADPVDPIPGNGVFVVGTDIAPGLYHGRVGIGLWSVDQQRADPGLNVFVVYLQHTRCGQRPCPADQHFGRSDVREHQYGSQGLRVAQLPKLDAGPLKRINCVQPLQN